MLPESLTQTIRAFQESRAVLTAIELDVFTAIGSGATAAHVANSIGTDARATAMLLNALVALGLLEKHDDVFRNTAETARYFVTGSPDDHRLAMMHQVNLWTRWSTLSDCVRTGTAVAERSAGAGGTESFIAAMHANASERAPAVVEAVGAAGLKRMLDIGGGSGAYSIAFALANPELRSEVLDLAAVVPLTRRYAAAAGVGDRVIAKPGDLHDPSYGSGYDLVFISAICHMLSPEEDRALVAKALAALSPGGRIAIQDFLLDPDRAGPRFAALFALNMLVGTSHGDSYTEAEYAGWLRQAGFEEVRRVDLPGPAQLMIASRPHSL